MPSIHSQYTCMLQYLVPRHSNRTVLQRTSTWCMHDQCRNHCTCSAFVEWSFNAGAYRSMVWPDPYFVPSLARSTDWADNPRIVAQSADPCFAQRNPRIVTDPWFAHNIYHHDSHGSVLVTWCRKSHVRYTQCKHTRFKSYSQRGGLLSRKMVYWLCRYVMRLVVKSGPTQIF